MADDNLDLAQILATLASLSKPQTPPVEAPQQVYDRNPTQGHQATHQPPQYPEHAHQHHDARLSNRPAPPTHSPSLPQHRTSTPPVNPATITEWKHGLRCINKVASQNPDFASAVRKLMKDQERNVKDWEAGRARLIDEQSSKRDNEKTHREALSLSGILGNSALLRTPDREREELDAYDLKVYRACRLMFDSQTVALKGLGVPFFGVRVDLVVADGGAVGGEDAGSGKITKSQLLGLQRKMLNHLMEMYGD
ncbi:hypothetical protein P280DRAFT_546444 [Massarina eburnea CBS 473.64]|uniref:Uncharacterized protein n=1 Tax=Massarina eburnea CBS 473.64 TaxID=1395130 RepID=A0A6A6SF59_9PLEO|nr:hypothetical protein P280DRAFT_546444 [Massarina eburnea CBS 473.64]